MLSYQFKITHSTLAYNQESKVPLTPVELLSTSKNLAPGRPSSRNHQKFPYPPYNLPSNEINTFPPVYIRGYRFSGNLR
jgi:hypothetical protein